MSAAVPAIRPATGCTSASRRRARQQRFSRRLAGVGRTAQTIAQIADPLSRARAPRTRRVGVIGLLVLGSLVTHLAGLLVLSFVSATLFAADVSHASRHERLAVAIDERARPPDTQRPPPRPPLPDVAPHPAPRPVPRPAALRPPDPTDQPPPAAAVVTAPQPRRIVGLSFESTVTGGQGPSYTVGNTRMGTTDRVATEPRAIERLVSRVEVARPTRLVPVRPVYPADLKEQGIEADVVLSVEIDEHGQVAAVRVVRGDRHSQFNDSAVAAARREAYTPAMRNGVPVPYVITYTVRFRVAS